MVAAAVAGGGIAAATALAPIAQPSAPLPTPEVQPDPAVPAKAAPRSGPDAMHWIMLGSAAVFLFIDWMAIYFGFRW
jgi:hypothetical protein